MPLLVVPPSGGHSLQPADILATATAFTAESIVDAWRRFIRPLGRVHEVIASGGGCHNLDSHAATCPGVRSDPGAAQRRLRHSPGREGGDRLRHPRPRNDGRTAGQPAVGHGRAAGRGAGEDGAGKGWGIEGCRLQVTGSGGRGKPGASFGHALWRTERRSRNSFGLLRGLQPGTCNPEPATRNPQPVT